MNVLCCAYYVFATSRVARPASVAKAPTASKPASFLTNSGCAQPVGVTINLVTVKDMLPTPRTIGNGKLSSASARYALLTCRDAHGKLLCAQSGCRTTFTKTKRVNKHYERIHKVFYGEFIKQHDGVNPTPLLHSESGPRKGTIGAGFARHARIMGEDGEVMQTFTLSTLDCHISRRPNLKSYVCTMGYLSL